MLLMRRFEERSAELYERGLIGGFLHRCGSEEAVIAGSASVLAGEDAVLTTFRAVPWVLARGGAPERVMAELLGRVDGVAGGRGGATHVLDVEHGVLGGWGIPGGHAPVAAGVALSGRLAVCAMTAGATAQGVVGETWALAATWGLPVVFVVTRDVGAVDPPAALTELFERGAAAGVAGLRCDGMDVLAVAHVVGDAVARARAGRPMLVEALIRRDVDAVATFGTRLEAEGVLDPDARAEIEAGVTARIDRAVAFAEASREPLASEL
ncbi:Acetoin:2,6-dichlorophenolindophenol oxidoreductase subunit alpha [Baekduia alba]|nr:Acetoin:2,6-dichlorophenolindophenol oxidoreductase subunit alpha [Baekduia alba]